jgi:hypothetical protein
MASITLVNFILLLASCQFKLILVASSFVNYKKMLKYVGVFICFIAQFNFFISSQYTPVVLWHGMGNKLIRFIIAHDGNCFIAVTNVIGYAI